MMSHNRGTTSAHRSAKNPLETDELSYSAADHLINPSSYPHFPSDDSNPIGLAGSRDRFYLHLRLGGFAASAGPDGADEAGSVGFSGASLAGNFAASLTMAAARSLLVLHTGS